MSAARAAILQRIGAVVGAEPARREVRRFTGDYRRTGTLPAEARIELFCRRVGEYKADVRRVAAGREAAEIYSAATACGARRLVVPPGLPLGLRPNALELVEDTELSPHALDAMDGVITASTLGIAETGTIVLTGAPDEGRRAIGLIPDLHICVVRAETIVELVPEALSRISAVVRESRRPVTLVSGPSATSDIELSRVEGVHGPRQLVVLVVA